MRRIKYYVLICVTVGCMALTGGCQRASGENVAKEKSEAAVMTEASRDEKGIGKEEILIVDQLGKEIVLDGVPERVATTIMPFPYIYYAISVYILCRCRKLGSFNCLQSLFHSCL